MSNDNIQYIKDSLTYDTVSGDLFWRPGRPKSHWKQEGYHKRYLREFAGKKTNPTINTAGYKTLWLNNTMQYEHRIAYILMTGWFPNGDIDHKNGIKTDNSWKNLRDVSHTVNGRNAKKPTTNSSGYTGVTLFKRTGKWRAYINAGQKQKHLGYFDTPEEAYEARMHFLHKNPHLGYTQSHGHRSIT